MDQFGDLILSWSIGYDGSPVYFLDNDTLCFLNGNCVKFINLENRAASYLQNPGDGINNLTINSTYNSIAFSEDGIDAAIFVYDWKDLSKPKVTLKGNGECLGYSTLSFANNGSLLASCANIPEPKLSLWNWIDSEELCVYVLDVTLSSIKFNPLDWKLICSADAEKKIDFWNIEKINESYNLHRTNINLPRLDGTYGLEYVNGSSTNGNRPTTGHRSLQLTKTAIAGLPKTGKKNFRLAGELAHCEAISHCWAPNNVLLCGTSNGFLLSIDTENQHVTILENSDQSPVSMISLDHMQLHKDGLFTSGKDGNLYCLKLNENSYNINGIVSIGKPVSCLNFSPDYETFVVSGETGFIYISEKGSSIKPILEDDCYGEVIGIDNLAASNQYFVTGRSEGLIQVWSTKESNYVSKFNINCSVTYIASPSSCSAAFVGTSYGSIIVVDFVDFSAPKCVYEIHLHKGPITFLKIDETGSLMMTSSTDNHLFFVNARISTGLEVVGHIDMQGTVLCLSLLSLHEHGDVGPWKAVVGLSTADNVAGCNHMIDMKIPEDLLKGKTSLYMDSTKLLKDASVEKRTYILKTSVHDISVVSNDLAVAIIHNGNRIAKFQLGQEQEAPSSNVVLDTYSTYPGHGLPGGRIDISCHKKWMVSGGPDGNIILRAIGAMNNIVCMQAGNYRLEGVTHVCFTADAQGVLTVNKNGVVSCWNWNFTSLGKSKANVAVTAYRSMRADVKANKNLEHVDIANRESLSPDTVGKEKETWLYEAIQKARKNEDERFATTKTNLRKEIDTLRNEVLSIMKTNEQVPDIEKLKRQEFNMDIDERNAMLMDREKALKNLRANIELEDTAKQYLWYLIKRDCWDDMVVKGRSLRSFSGTVVVENYPMRERTREELAELEYVKQQRTIEDIDVEIRNHVFPPEASSHSSLVEIENVEGDEESSEKDSTKKESAALYGSLGYKYSGNNPLLHNQFTLHSKTPKKYQIIMLKDCIHHIKEEFNKHFTEVFKAKHQEIKRVQDRNVRIKKIIDDLHLDESLTVVGMSQCENPENLFIVEDHEIPFEKYISEEERVRLDEQARIDEERRLAENVDNLRGRALDTMMAGRLETGLEDALKIDIERPEFMDKPLDKWTEEEQKSAKDYEKAKINLAEEREKFRKSLELELKKLQTTNVDATAAFDDRLNKLFQRKIKTEAVVLQEQLKIIRLRASVLLEEELEGAEMELLANLEMKKEEKQQSSLTVGNARREVEAFRDAYETLVADDKMLDKMFRKEFTELDTHTIDVLYRLFKRRPRGQRTLKVTSETPTDNNTPHIEGSPFQLRPSSSRAASAAATILEKSLQELDNEQHKPENIGHEVWAQLITLRRAKVEKEQQLKAKALVLAHMNAFLQKKTDKDEDLKLDIENSFEDIQRLREERLRFNLNLEVQLLLKQGQIEVGKWDFVPDYTESLLIHRSAVEDFNAVIKTLGESKLESMRESKEFRKGIHLLAWELKEMYMRAEDLQTTAMDLQLLRVTKHLQAYLSDTDQRQSKQQEITTLEKTIEAYAERHGKKVGDKKRMIRKLRRQIKEKEDENKHYDVKLEEISIDVAERKNIHDVVADKVKDTGSESRMKVIITRRKLTDLAKAQVSEIGMLRSEVERLRMRTFPALQLES